MEIDLTSDKVAFERYILIFKRLDRMEEKLDKLLEQKAPKDRSNEEKATKDALKEA